MCWPPVCAGLAALLIHQLTTDTGAQVSWWVILRLANHKKWWVTPGRALRMGFEPRCPRQGFFLVLGVFDTNDTQSAPFLAIFGPFLGHIVEFQGQKGLFVTEQSWRM